MTWSTFIDAIRGAQITNAVPWRIINDLFVEAGDKVGPAEPTARMWLNGKRNCDSRRYFPNQKIDSNKVFAFFRNRPEEKLQNLQKSFQEKIDAGDPVDVNTKDLDTFCWSLVNQFLDLLKFERVDIPQPRSGTTNTETIFPPHNHKCCLYCVYWEGNSGIIGVSKMPIDGTCHTYNGNRHRLCSRLSSTAACPNYKADQNLINRMKESGFDIKDLI